MGAHVTVTKVHTGLEARRALDVYKPSDGYVGGWRQVYQEVYGLFILRFAV